MAIAESFNLFNRMNYAAVNNVSSTAFSEGTVCSPVAIARHK
jgi:hypothetical protein